MKAANPQPSSVIPAKAGIQGFSQAFLDPGFRRDDDSLPLSRHSASLALMAALALSACSVGPPYQRPALDVPANFRGEAPSVANTPTMGELAWWDVYRDPALRRLMETALTRNRDLQLAASRVAEAAALAGQARTAQWPQINVGIGGQRGRVVQNGGYVTGSVFNGSLDLSYEIDLWRRLASLTEAAQANLIAARAGRQAVEVGLMSGVATAYFTLLTLDRQIAITQRTIANRERFLDMTRRMADRGAASQLDVNRAEASLAQARGVLPDVQRQIEQTENQLQILLGDNPAPVDRQAWSAMPTNFLPDVPAGLPSALLERRPDLIQAESFLVAATADVNAAKASLFPSITLTGSTGSESFELSKLFTGPTKVWSVGLDLIQPLINAQRNRDVVNAAQARKQQAMIQYQSAVAQAFRDVADALAARRTYADLALAQQQQVDALTRAQSLVLKRYQVGKASYFEVIDADASLLAAELQLAEAQRNGLVASVQLYQALGGGWSPPRPMPK